MRSEFTYRDLLVLQLAAHRRKKKHREDEERRKAEADLAAVHLPH